MDPNLDWVAYKAFERYRVVHWCSATMIVYDWVVTVNKERKYIWRDFTVSWASIGFLMNRYWTLLLWAPLSVFFLTADFTEEACSRTFLVLPYVFVVQLLAAQVVLICRVSAIWANQRRTWLPLGALYLCAVAIAFYAPSNDAMSWIPGVSQCSAVIDPRISEVAWISYIVPTLVELICVILAYYKLRQLKKIGGNTLLLHRLTRDSLFYFVIAFGINLANIIWYSRDTTWGYAAILSVPTVAITAIVCSRLVLSLREDSAGGELSGSYDDTHSPRAVARSFFSRIAHSLRGRSSTVDERDDGVHEAHPPQHAVFALSPLEEAHVARKDGKERIMSEGSRASAKSTAFAI